MRDASRSITCVSATASPMQAPSTTNPVALGNQRSSAPPSGWRIYPHAGSDGKALHLVEVEGRQDILDHMQHFDDIYEHTAIVEIVDRG